MAGDLSSGDRPTGVAPGFLTSRTSSGRGTVHTPLADDGVFGLSGLGDGVEGGDGVDIYYRGSDPGASDVVAVVRHGDPGPGGVAPPSPPDHDDGQRVGLGVVEESNSGGGSIGRRRRLAVRSDLVRDRVPLAGVDGDAAEGDVVWVIGEGDPEPYAADDVVAVVPVGTGRGSEAAPPPGDINADEGVVESVYGAPNGARAAIATPLADDGTLYLSGIDADIAEGDIVRLRYSGTDPSADDVVSVEPTDEGGSETAVASEADPGEAEGDEAASPSVDDLPSDQGIVETTVRDTRSADGDVRARIVTPLADDRALSMSGLDGDISTGDRVRLRYSGTDPSAEDIVAVERVDDTAGEGDDTAGEGDDTAGEGDDGASTPDPDHVTVESDGVRVVKDFEPDQLEAPVVAFQVDSERDDRVEVTVVDGVPDGVPMNDVGFHPEYGADGWTVYEDRRLKYRRELGPGETTYTLYGLRSGAETIDALERPLGVAVDPIDDGGSGGAGNRTTADDGDETGAVPDPARPWPDPGVPERLTLAFDDWETGDLIDTGGNAEVYEASVAAEDRTIAVKAPPLAAGESMGRGDQSEFLAEAELWHRVDDHPHVVRVLDSGAEPFPWIAMELLSGGTLDERAPLATPTALGVADAVIDAVTHAHDLGVTHGDLKPANVLFTADGEAGVPKVADWGLARALLEEGESSVGDVTPKYAAPEQLDGESLTPRERKLSDVYAVGAVVYEALTGRAPFEGSTYAVLDAIRTESPPAPSDVADVPPALDAPVLGALAKDPTDRPPTMFHLRESLLGG